MFPKPALASLPAQPDWFPSSSAGLAVASLLAGETNCIFWFCLQQLSCGMSCSAPQSSSLGLGELLCTHRSVLVPLGVSQSSLSPVWWPWSASVAQPCSAPHGCTGDVHPKGSRALRPKWTHPNARKAEDWPRPWEQRAVTPGGAQERTGRGTQCLGWVTGWTP